jgi:hypothetical protein
MRTRIEQDALAVAGSNVTISDLGTPNLSALVIETLAVFKKPGFATWDDQQKGAALQGLYTLWYFAGVSLGILPPLPGQQKGILPHFAVEYQLSESLSLKDGRLGYTNHSTLTWQARPAHAHSVMHDAPGASHTINMHLFNQ